MKKKGLSPIEERARVLKVLKTKHAGLGEERRSLEDIENRGYGVERKAGRKTD
jgi:hypothetical protein